MSGCRCACHVYRTECDIDDGSSGVPGVKYCGAHTGDDDAPASSVVGVCAHPRCESGKDGQPAQIDDGLMCRDCRRKYRQLIRWLAEDHIALKADLPSPVPRGRAGGKRVKDDSFGHPAEWASDKAAEIATALHWAAEMFAESINITRGVDLVRWAQPKIMWEAFKFIQARWDAFTRCPATPELVRHFLDLHRQVREGFGYFRTFEQIPVRCPKCDSAGTLSVEVGGAGPIRCSACGHQIDADYRDFYVKVFAQDKVDQLLAEYDQRKAEERHGLLMAIDIEEPWAAAHAADYAASHGVPLLPPEPLVPCDVEDFLPLDDTPAA